MNENKQDYKKEKRILIFKTVVLYAAFICSASLLSLGFVAILKYCNDEDSLTSFSICVSCLINALIFIPGVVNSMSEIDEIRDKEKENKKVS